MDERPAWLDETAPNPLPWLLEETDPSARLLTLRWLLDAPLDSAAYRDAAASAHRSGPIATILDAMQPEGWWVKPGTGYSPKYTGSVWSLIALAQLGADAAFDPRVQIAAKYYLDQALKPGGQITAGSSAAWTADCLQGNMIASILKMGIEDERLTKAVDWMARTITGEGIAPVGDRSTPNRFYGAGKCGPGFICAANDKQPCAWGAVKVMTALTALPAAMRTPATEIGLKLGAEFLLSGGPLAAAWPHPYAEKPSGNWRKFGFPLFYISDLLEAAAVLLAAGHAEDPRVQELLMFIRGKQTPDGPWLQELSYDGKTWVRLGRNKAPNKYVTIRALKVLKYAAA